MSVGRRASCAAAQMARVAGSAPAASCAGGLAHAEAVAGANRGCDEGIMAMQPTFPSVPSHYDAVRTISPEALLQVLRSEVRLAIVDVRNRPEIRATGTIEAARTFPLCQLGPRIAELEDLHASTIIVVSQRGRRARSAALVLQASGFGEVFVLEGGIDEWLALRYPVEARRESSPSSRP